MSMLACCRPQLRGRAAGFFKVLRHRDPRHRFLARLATLMFVAVEQGRLTLPWVHPDTAPRHAGSSWRCCGCSGWSCRIPYLPGSQSEAFKGVSVFVGLIVSLGSSGVMNQVMSGLTSPIRARSRRRLREGRRRSKARSRARHAGHQGHDAAERGDHHSQRGAGLGRDDELLAVSPIEGVFAPTSVTIGYDTPWRQVHALLLLAAARTEGVRNDPKPVGPADEPAGLLRAVHAVRRARTATTGGSSCSDTLHRHIQDAFNEYGVQIMSPKYRRIRRGRRSCRRRCGTPRRHLLRTTTHHRRWPWRWTAGGSLGDSWGPPRCRRVKGRRLRR